eukprot:COSAG06_NODE_56968_length_282_cov_0.852459_1_plen_43_part_10
MDATSKDLHVDDPWLPEEPSSHRSSSYYRTAPQGLLLPQPPAT